MGMSDTQIKVMVVEDSAYMRYVISEFLDSDPEIKVVEKARDGVDALEKLALGLPDVMTLDIQMPRMDGLKLLEEMRGRYRVPTIMVSSLTFEGAEDTIRALELGAVDFVPKPSGVLAMTIDQLREEIIAKVKAASQIKPLALAPPAESVQDAEPGRKQEPGAGPRRAAPVAERIAQRKAAARQALQEKAIPLKKVVAVGSSTGGPRALTEIIPLLPADIPACVVVVQHMPPKFTASLAERLDAISEIQVKEAANGDKIRPGIVYIAPGDYHILAGKNDVLYLSQDPPQHGVRPSVNVFMQSVASVYGERGVGVVLTGMGTDGRSGALAIKEHGGYMLAEHENSCVVYGMPRAAIEAGAVDRVAMLQRMADEILTAIYS